MEFPAIRRILREDYPCTTCGAKRGDHCHTLSIFERPRETDPHQSRWEQYRLDSRHRFAPDISPERRSWFRSRQAQDLAAGPNDSLIDTITQRHSDFEPSRDDAVAGWLKRQRDTFKKDTLPWDVLDHLLDRYRLHADTGTRLEFEVHEGGHDAEK